MRTFRSSHQRLVVPLAVAMGLSLAACGDGDDAIDPVADAVNEADDGASDEATEPTTYEAPAKLTVTAVNYGFPDLPSEIEAGTTITLQNDAEDEVHEIIALRVNDGEERPLQELLELDEEELFGLVEFRGVALAPPGEDSSALPTPPLTLEQPGRYAFVCFIPTGAPPAEVMQAVQDYFAAGAPDDAEPEYPETGPPHLVNGMVAEATVTAG